MFGLGFQEILLILVILFLIFGVKKLPEIGKGLGETVKEIRKFRGEKKPEKEKEEKRNRRIPDASDVFYLVRTPNLISVAGRLFSLLNPKGEMECDLGFNDPSATGILAAVVAFLTSFAPGVQERIRFNYLEAELRGYLRLGMLVWLPQLFVGGVAIALGEDGRELVIHLWGLRRRRAARVA